MKIEKLPNDTPLVKQEVKTVLETKLDDLQPNSIKSSEQPQSDEVLAQKKTISYEETRVSDDIDLDPALKENLKRLEKFRKLAPKQLPVDEIDFGEELPAGKSWMYISELPSNMLGYPPGVVILYTPYTFEELDTINDGNLSSAETLAFMSKGIFIRGMQVNDLYMSDLLYICLLRKLSSLGSDTFSVQYKHFDVEDQTETVYSQVYHLNEISFKHMEAPDLPARVKIHGEVMEFKPITLGNYLPLVNLNRVGNNSSSEKYYLMAACVTNMDQETALLYIRTAIGTDITRLTFIDSCLNMGVEPVKFTYVHKGRRYTKAIDIMNINALVTPFCLISESSGNPVRFGVHEDS